MLAIKSKKYLKAFGWLMAGTSTLGGFIGMMATLFQCRDQLWTDGWHQNSMNWIQFAIMFAIFVPGATAVLAKFITLDD